MPTPAGALSVEPVYQAHSSVRLKSNLGGSETRHEMTPQSGNTTSPAGARRLATITRRVLLRVLVVLILAGAISASAASSIAFKDRATRALRTELTLNGALTYIYAYRYTGQAYAHGAVVEPADFKQLGGLEGAAHGLVAQLARETTLGRPFVAMNNHVEQLMAREMQLVRAHQLRAATSLDSGAVTSAVNPMIGLMSADAPKLAAQAAAASGNATSGIIASVVIAGAVVLLVLAGYESSRRRQLRTAAEVAAVAASRQRFASLLRHASDLVAVVGTDGSARFETPSAAALLGCEEDALVGRDMTDLVHPDDRRLFRLLCQKGGHKHAELRLRGGNGAYRRFELQATDLLDHTDIQGIVLNGRDVTEQKQLEEELRHQALHDALTGLANRTLFNNRVDHALARNDRAGADLAVLWVDLDNFKSVNDLLGHANGDLLLIEVANRLSGVVRRGDTVSRLGGDEFAVLLDSPLAPGEPQAVAQRIQDALSAPVTMAQGNQTVQASIGIALATPGAAAEDLVRDADLAMYVAKQQGKGRAVTFEEGMRHEVQERLGLTRELAAALEAGDQLALHYQPIVRLDGEEVIGVEALLRWQHPTRGAIPPLSFIPLAEESGLIVELGRWVLQEATHQMAAWAAESPVLAPLFMSVNVSARQLDEPRFVEDVRWALDRAGLAPEALVLEITESVIMQRANGVLDRLMTLRGLGVRVAIDDFGTGYSSLGYLKHLPVDLVKVDRSFTTDLDEQAPPQALAEAIVRLGATLQLETIAEGIESLAQAEHLRSLSCEYGQGYLFARPLPPAECRAFLLSGKLLTVAPR